MWQRLPWLLLPLSLISFVGAIIFGGWPFPALALAVAISASYWLGWRQGRR